MYKGVLRPLIAIWEASDRLCAADKAKKVALTACIRKLLTILNAMMKHNTTWQCQSA